jgi:hypothetical protein
LAKKIIEKVGVFLSATDVGIQSPRLPRIPPRSHHKFTTAKRRFFQNPLKKRQ